MAKGANIYGTGIFWWPTFQSNKDKYGRDYTADRQYWTHWISNYGNFFKNNLIYHKVNRNYQNNNDIILCVNQLKKIETRIQLIDLGWVQSNGQMEGNIQNLLSNYILISKSTDVNQRIVAVINSRSDILLGNNMAQSTFLKELAVFLQNFQVEGIQLNLNPYLKDDPRYLDFLKKVRLLMGDKFLAVTAPCFSVRWSNSFITNVAGMVDMINVLMFDMQGIPDWGPDVVYNSVQYKAVWNENILRYSDSISESSNPDCLLTPIMPCYEKQYDENGVLYHDPEIENIFYAGNGLIQAIQNGANVYGTGVYYWEFLNSQKPDQYGRDYSLDRRFWNDWNDWIN